MCELHQLRCIAIVGGDQDDVVARQAAPSTTCVTHDSAPGLYLWIYSLHFSQISLEDLRKKSLIQQPILDDDILKVEIFDRTMAISIFCQLKPGRMAKWCRKVSLVWAYIRLAKKKSYQTVHFWPPFRPHIQVKVFQLGV